MYCVKQMNSTRTFVCTILEILLDRRYVIYVYNVGNSLVLVLVQPYELRTTNYEKKFKCNGRASSMIVLSSL